MKKLPFFTGLAMILVESLILGSYIVSNLGISESAWNVGVILAMLIPINFVAMGLFIFGMASKDE